MAALAITVFAAACSTSTSDGTPLDQLRGFSGTPLEVPTSDRDAWVKVSTSELRAGDYYGSIRIKSDLPGMAVIHLPVHATVFPATPAPVVYYPPRFAPPEPNNAALSQPVQTAPRETVAKDVRWVVPPPSRAEAGVDYRVSYYGWVRLDENSYTSAEVAVAETQDLRGDADARFEEVEYGSPGRPIEGTLRFESCEAQTVYVYLRWYANDESNLGSPVRVEVSPPSKPRPILYPSRITASTVEGPNSGPFATLGIRSLCNLGMHWKVLNRASWLDVSPADGRGSGSVSLVPTAPILAPGDYRASVVVALADGGRASTSTVAFSVNPIRLQWDLPPLPLIGPGEELLAIVRGVPGFAPYRASLWIEADGAGNADYYSLTSASAIPRVDGSFVAPVRIPSCVGGRYRLRAQAYGVTSGRGEAPPASIEVKPAEGPILDVSPLNLQLYVSESDTNLAQGSREFRVSTRCGAGFGMATLTATQPWILLENATIERQGFE